jgi:hypothetical protein
VIRIPGTVDVDVTVVVVVIFELLRLPSVDVLAAVETLVGDFILDEDVPDFNVEGFAGTVNREKLCIRDNCLFQFHIFNNSFFLNALIDSYLLEVFPQSLLVLALVIF